MNILHASTTPPLLERLKDARRFSHRADIAVGYLFISGFNAVAEELGRLEQVRVLVGRTDRPTLEEVARGLQQAEALQARVEGDDIVRDWLQGPRLVQRDRRLATLCLALGLGAVGQVIINFVRQALRGSALTFGWLITVQGVGGILGGLTASGTLVVIALFPCFAVRALRLLANGLREATNTPCGMVF